METEISESDMQFFNFVFSFAVDPQSEAPTSQQLQLFATLFQNRITRRNLRFTVDTSDSENPVLSFASDAEDLDNEESGLSSLANAAAASALRRTGLRDSLLLDNLNLITPSSSDNNAHPLGNSPAIYTHEYDSSGLRLFTAGGPIGSAFSGNFAILWH